MWQSGFNNYMRSGFAATPNADVYGRNQRAPLGAGGTFLLIEDTAYFVYMGQLAHTRIPLYVEFVVTTVGSGAQTAEVGLFSTPLPPNKAAQSVSKITSTGTVDSLTGTGVKRNTSAFSTPCYAGTYLWAGIRTAMATNEPTLRGAELDFAQGYLLSTATAGALTGAGPWTGALTAGGTVTVGPTLRIVYD